MRYKKIISLAALAAVFPLAALAQTAPPAPAAGLSPESLKMMNAPTSGYIKLSNCFNYYKTGSVEINIGAEKGQFIIPGAEIKFQGFVLNTNSYPIVDGAVYAKIYKAAAKNSNPAGDNLVAEFYAVKGLNIAAGKQAPVSFSFKLPNFAMTGDYYIVSDFTAGDFYLSGIPYSGEIYGSKSDFTVSGIQNDGVVFDENSVKVNGQPYDFPANSPSAGKTKPITVSFKLANLTDRETKSLVTYTLYADDNIKQENILSSTSELVDIAAQSSKTLSYTINDVSRAAYYLVAMAGYKDAESLIDVRAVRQGVDELKINYAGISNYPLKPADWNALNVCASNISGGQTNGNLVLTVLGEDGKPVWSDNYQGPFNGAITGFSGVFKSGNTTNFSIKADLYQNGKLSDTSTLTYNCKAIDPKLCGGFVSSVAVLAVLAILLIVLALLYWVLEKNKLKANLS